MGGATYDLRGLSMDFVVHYGGDDSQIDAFTFANSLMALATALQAANKTINPGYTLEVSVTALGGGSFRPRLRARAKKLATLLIGDLRQTVVSALAGFVIARLIGDPHPSIEIKDSDVYINYATGDVTILPKDVYRDYSRIINDEEVASSVQQSFEVLAEDDAVTSFGFARNAEETENLPLKIDRLRFADIARPALPLREHQREIFKYNARLRLLRAIFEDSARRWQFVWQGVRISAPVLDIDFRRQVVQGKVAFRHGDVLIAKLRIVQTSTDAGIWINDLYEVVEVKEHIARPHQMDMLD